MDNGMIMFLKPTIEEPLKVKIIGEKLKNFVIFSSKKCDVFDFKSVTV